MHRWGAQLTERPIQIMSAAPSEHSRQATHLLGPDACVCGGPRLIARGSCPAAVTRLSGYKLYLIEFIVNFLLYICQKYLYTSDT
jgi:hypothetical protein